MKHTTPIPVLTAMLAAAFVINAAPASVNRRPSPSLTTLAVPLKNHNNGQFWSTAAAVEGSPRAGIDTALDTGGGQFILPSSAAPSCLNWGCVRGTLNTTGLTTLVDLNIKFSESFKSGSITGDIFQDTVSLDGVNLGNIKFGLATGSTGTVLSAGTIGLGRVNNFKPELVSFQIIKTQTFSLLLSEAGGEMMLGGINPGNFLGSIRYVKGAQADDGFWRLDVIEFEFSGSSSASLENTQFILDTGSPTTTLPTSTIQALADYFEGIVTEGLAVVPCNNIDGETFSIGFEDNVGFTIPLSDFSKPTSGGQSQINFQPENGTPTIGVDLLSLFYTVWQVESNTIGFAIAASSPVSATAVKVMDYNNLPSVIGVATS